MYLVTNNERGTRANFKPAKTSRETRTSRDRRHYSRTSPATQPMSRTHPIRCMTTSAASVLRLSRLQITSAEAQGGLEKIQIFQIQIFTRARAQPGSHAAKSPRRDAKDLEASYQHSRDSFMQWFIIVMTVLCSKHKGWLFELGPDLSYRACFSSHRQPNSSCVQRVLFSRPSFCSVFFSGYHALPLL